MEGPADALARRHQAIPQDQTAYQAWQRVLFGNQVSDISLARAGMGEYLDDLGQHPSLETVDISETDIPGQLRALAQERLPAVLIMSGCGLTSAHVEELTAGPDADPRLRCGSRKTPIWTNAITRGCCTSIPT